VRVCLVVIHTVADVPGRDYLVEIPTDLCLVTGGKTAHSNSVQYMDMGKN